MTPNALETKGGNWEPVIVHTDREWFQNEHFPRRLKRSKSEALRYADKIISGRLIKLGLPYLPVPVR